MKKLNIALLASALLMAASAQAHWKSNWLLGVSGGGAWQNENDSFKVTVSSSTSSQTFVIANDNEHNGFIWGFLGGYQVHNDRLLVGLELNVDWRSKHHENVSFAVFNPAVGPVVGTINRKRDAADLGITARLGYNVMPCLMPYIRLGVDYGEQESEFFGTTTGLVDNLPFDVTGTDDERWGFVAGAGLEYFMPFVAGLSLRAEWNYHTRSHSDTLTAPLGVVTIPTNIGISDGSHRQQQTARASLVYNFPV